MSDVLTHNQRAEAFTWCSREAWWREDPGTLFVHGDQINRNDKNYLRFKKLTKNNLTKYILRFLPLGPKIADTIKSGLKRTNSQFRWQMPWDEINYFAESWFAEGVDTIFMGHFHREYRYRKSNQESKILHLLPDWLSTQKITVFQKDPTSVLTGHWTKLLQTASGGSRPRLAG